MTRLEANITELVKETEADILVDPNSLRNS